MRGERLFARRLLVLWLAFVLPVLLSVALWRAAPERWAPLAGRLSLPESYLLSVAPPPAGWMPLFLLPAGAILLAWAIRAWGAAYLSYRVVGDRRLHSGRLVVEGPFRHVRNPLYVGLLVDAAAAAAAFPPPAAALVAITVAVVLVALARVEARGLALRHPEYAEYARHVPAMLPRLTPWRGGAGGAVPRWREGVLGEAWHAAPIAGFVLLATPARAAAIPVFVAIVALWVVTLRRRGIPLPGA